MRAPGSQVVLCCPLEVGHFPSPEGKALSIFLYGQIFPTVPWLEKNGLAGELRFPRT